MLGLNEFLQIFGAVTVSQIVKWVLVLVFFILLYKQIKKFVDHEIEKQKKIEAEKKAYKDKIESSYNVTQLYPRYHQESIDIRDSLQKEIKEIRDNFGTIIDRLNEIETQNKKRECSKLRDMLLQNYRYYTNPQHNPSKSWTRMESEAFWELFKEYEEAGGDGYMHTVVQPAMEELLVIEIGHR